MRKELLVSVCALGLLVGANNAFAGAYGEPVEPEEAPAPPPAPAAVIEEEEVDYARTGFYIGAGGNYAFNNFDGLNSTPGGPAIVATDSVDNSAGYFVRAGYRVHANVAVEARFEHYLGFETDPGPGHLEGYSIMANVKGFLLTGRYQPYVLFGMGYLDLNSPGVDQGDEIAGDDFAMRFGGGLDAYITENLSMGPELAYLLPTGDASDLDMLTLSLGLNYRF
ncbi:MAG: outer membrane beta-barrel protein [Candidatus Binatia bacterium]